MSKLKELLEKIIYVDEEVEPEEKKEEVVEKEPVEEKPIKPHVMNQPIINPIIRNPGTSATKPELINPEAVRKESGVDKVIETTGKVRVGITLQPQKPPVKEEPAPVEKPVEEVKKEEPAPVEEPKKEVKKEPVEKQEYTKVGIISPVFGLTQEPGSKPKAKKQVREEPKLYEMPSEKKSVLGTVMSPLYGNKKKEQNVSEDKVDPKVASLSVQDIISNPKPVKNSRTAELRIKKLREEGAAKVREVSDKKTRMPDLTVSPFGNKRETPKPEVKKENPVGITLHDAWTNADKKKVTTAELKVIKKDAQPEKVKEKTDTFKFEIQDEKDILVEEFESVKEKAEVKPEVRKETASDTQLFDNITLFDLEEK